MEQVFGIDKEVLVALLGFGGAVIPAVIGLFPKSGDAEHRRASIAIGQWTVLLAMAAGLSGALAGPVGAAFVEIAPMENASPHLANWAFFGVVIGSAQWLALMSAGANPKLWILATTIGWTPCALFFTEPWAWPAFGALSALLQSVLNPRSVSKPIVWIGANALGWFVAGNAGVFAGVAFVEQIGFAAAWVAGWAVVGFTAGLITGLFANACLARPEAAS